MGVGNLKTILESLNKKFDYVSNADNALDGKAGTLLGFEIAILLGYLSLIFKELEGCNFFIGSLGLVFLFISLVVLFYVNWPKNYITTFVNISKHKEYLIKKERELLLQLISDSQSAFQKNNNVLKVKVRSYKTAIVCLMLSSILLIISII